MENIKIIAGTIIVIFCGLALGVGVVSRLHIARFAGEQPTSFLTLKSFFIFLACLFCTFIGWLIFSLLVSKISRLPYFEVLYYDSYSFLPLLFMTLTIGQKSFFLSLRFFHENNNVLLLICGAGIIYLKIHYLNLLLNKYPSSPLAYYQKKIKSFFSRVFIEERRWKFNLFFLTLFIYLLLASGLFTQVAPLSGDEPHYLVLTNSILKDHDIEVSNNYANQDYYPFYPGNLEPAAHRGKRSAAHLYANHPPGFSLFLLPFYFLGQVLGGRWLLFALRGSICILAALLSISIASFLKEVFKDGGITLLGWLVVSFTSPLLFYSRHLYPEIPAALISLLVVKAIRVIGGLNWQKLLVMGVGIGILPWLGQKFLLLSFALIAIAIVYLWKNKALLSRKLIFILSAIIFIGLFYFYLYYLYGVFSPRSIMTGYLGAEVRTEWGREYFLNWQLKPKIATLMSYFIDQKEGLLIYAPIYLFCFVGLYELIHISRSDFWLLSFLLAVQIGLHAYVHQSSGFSPPTRPLVAGVWLLAIFLTAGFKSGSNRYMKNLRNVLLIVSFIIAILLTIYPHTLYQNIVKNTMTPSKLYSNLSTIYFDFTKLLPSLLDLDTLSYKAIIFWLIILLAAMLGLYFLSIKKETPEYKKEAHKYSRAIAWAMLMLTFCFFLFCLFPRVRLDRLNSMEFPADIPFKAYFLRGNCYGPELGGFWVRGESEARIILQTPVEAKQLNIKLRSPITQTVKIGVADFCWAKKIAINGNSFLTLSLPKPLRFRKSWLYLINIQPQAGFYPYKIIPGSTDSRYLGIFTEVRPVYKKINDGL